MKINDVYVQLILKEISRPSFFERTTLGGLQCYARPDGRLLKKEVCEPKKHTKRILKISKKSWWKKYGDIARHFARQNGIPGPNIWAVAPRITPELYREELYISTLYDLKDEEEVRSLTSEILLFLEEEGFIKSHHTMKGYFALTGKGSCRIFL